MDQNPQVGVGILITKDNKVLLMKRKGLHGKGTWSTPGGHIEFGETPEQCAAREAKEEVGVDVFDVQFRAVTNDLFERQGRHYITIWMEVQSFSGEPTVAAEEEVAELGWYAWDALPSPLFLPLENLLKENSYPPK
ncbi:MAG TPA: NUDIX domain-containing protein [Anaerolineales bacterium]|nr:NUDIX domain-containing protein [Anaerolineales bacterium]